MDVLKADRVVLGVKLADKAEAIRLAGEVLVKAGCVAPAYIDGMLARERIQSTYLGNGVAIPHGELADLRFVLQTGVSVVQVPGGVEWEPGESVYLVIGLASKNDQHAGVMANLVELLQSPDEILPLFHTVDPTVIIESLTRGRSEKQWN